MKCTQPGCPGSDGQGCVHVASDRVAPDGKSQFEREALLRFAERIRGWQFDETASGNGGTDPLSIAREQGYRAGHNDAVRAVIKLLEAK